jgi:hypothetical protein
MRGAIQLVSRRDHDCRVCVSNFVSREVRRAHARLHGGADMRARVLRALRRTQHVHCLWRRDRTRAFPIVSCRRGFAIAGAMSEMRDCKRVSDFVKCPSFFHGGFVPHAQAHIAIACISGVPRRTVLWSCCTRSEFSVFRNTFYKRFKTAHFCFHLALGRERHRSAPAVVTWRTV